MPDEREPSRPGVVTPGAPPTERGPSHTDVNPDANEKQALEEREQSTVNRPGGYANDPDDPTNPNEAIERSRRTRRP
jgi:hypothetical protein